MMRYGWTHTKCNVIHLPLHCDTSFNKESWFQQHIENGTNETKTQSKSKFAKEQPDLKNRQNKRNKKQTNTNEEFPKLFCFCADVFHCFCDFGFLGCFLLIGYCLEKTSLKQTHHNNICYKRKRRAENV